MGVGRHRDNERGHKRKREPRRERVCVRAQKRERESREGVYARRRERERAEMTERESGSVCV